MAREALVLDPKGSDALALAHILFKQRRWLDCARTCQEIQTVQAGNTDAMVILAECLVNMEDIPSALEIYRHASQTNPEDVSIRSRLQELESRPGTEVPLTPEQEAAIQRGLSALENDEAAEALQQYRNAQALGPAHPDLDHIVRELEIRITSSSPIRVFGAARHPGA